MRILVTGSNGQVGQALAAVMRDQPELTCIPLGRAELDISSEPAVLDVLARHAPDAVVNAAAYTAVDKAESEPGPAHRINADAAGILARSCAARTIPLLHYSTDFVFDGSLDRPYREDDRPDPLGAYGESKLAGEQAVREALDAHLVLRVSWVFSATGSNFVKTMLRLGGERPTLRIVDDQVGGPTAARDIAGCTLRLLAHYKASGALPWGTYHYCGAPAVSWYGFATEIFRQAAARGMTRTPALAPITTADYPTPARRPANSVLDCSRLAQVFDIPQPDWRQALAADLGELL